MTKQRRIILDELRSADTHPTADQLYLAIKDKLPHIGLATVYRNLDLLVREGLIQKLEFGGSQKRFDGNPQEHYHMRCLSCGEVRDGREQMPALQSTPGSSAGYEITGYHLEFTGYCARCKNDHND